MRRSPLEGSVPTSANPRGSESAKCCAGAAPRCPGAELQQLLSAAEYSLSVGLRGAFIASSRVVYVRVKCTVTNLGNWRKRDPDANPDSGALFGVLAGHPRRHDRRDRHRPRTAHARGEASRRPRHLGGADGLPGRRDHAAAHAHRGGRRPPLAAADARGVLRGPARLLSLPAKGHIAIGHDADLVLVDPAARYRLAAASLHYRVGWTPFEGKRFRAACSPHSCAAARWSVTARSSPRPEPGGSSAPRSAIPSTGGRDVTRLRCRQP